MEAQQLVHGLTSEGADASEDGTGRGTPLVVRSNQTGANGIGWQTDAAYALQATSGADAVMPTLGAYSGRQQIEQPYVSSANLVRRLTPLECERLQAFPDGWTCLDQPLEAYIADPEQATWDCKCPDGPRYRALGNAVTLSVIEWIGLRLRGVHG